MEVPFGTISPGFLLGVYPESPAESALSSLSPFSCQIRSPAGDPRHIANWSPRSGLAAADTSPGVSWHEGMRSWWCVWSRRIPPGDAANPWSSILRLKKILGVAFASADPAHYNSFKCECMVEVNSFVIPSMSAGVDGSGCSGVGAFSSPEE